MSISLTYDGTLSRVRIAATTYLNANPFFEVDASSWSQIGSTVGRSTAQFHQGVASLLLTPDGVSSDAQARAAVVTAAAGTSYRASAWVRCAVSRTVRVTIDWLTSGGVLISSSNFDLAVVANTWTFLSGTATAPATTGQARLIVHMTSTPPAGNTLYIDEAMIGPATSKVERSTDQIRWLTVRGGGSYGPGVSLKLDDYEFAVDVGNYYRVAGQTANITPTLSEVWLKSIAFPFLNCVVTVGGVSDIGRPSRAGTFEVIGRARPVVATDVRGSRRFTLAVNTYSPEEADAVNALLASGDVLLVQAPTTVRVSVVPTAYVSVGDTSEEIPPTLDLANRVFSLRCTEAAPPVGGAGATITWQGVLNRYASWSALIAAKATWADVLDLIGDAGDVVIE